MFKMRLISHKMFLREFNLTIKITILCLLVLSLIDVSIARNINSTNQDETTSSNNGLSKIFHEVRNKFIQIFNFQNEKSHIDASTQTGEPNRGDLAESGNSVQGIHMLPQDNHHATPHPSIQLDGFKDVTSEENSNFNIVDHGLQEFNKEDEEESSGMNEGDFINNNYIPDCDIPPYPEWSSGRREEVRNIDDGLGDVKLELVPNDDLTMENSSKIGRVISSGGTEGSLFEEKNEDSNNNNGDPMETDDGSDKFLMKLQTLKKSLDGIMRNPVPLPESNLLDVVNEMNAVLKDKFGDVGDMKNNLRVKDIAGRAKMERIKDCLKKSPEDSSESGNRIRIEIKKAKKYLKFITHNEDEKLAADYVNVMQELISMLRTTKNSLKNVKEKGDDEEISEISGPISNVRDLGIVKKAIAKIDFETEDENASEYEKIIDGGNEVDEVSNRNRARKFMEDLDSISESNSQVKEYKKNKHKSNHEKVLMKEQDLSRLEMNLLEELNEVEISLRKKNKKKNKKKKAKERHRRRTLEDL